MRKISYTVCGYGKKTRTRNWGARGKGRGGAHKVSLEPSLKIVFSDFDLTIHYKF